MIPKIIHSIWLGDSIQPDNYIEDWKKLNPDYEYRHWTESDIWNLDHILVPYAKSVKDPTMKSDIMRIVLLDLFGGVYTDVDIKPYYSIPAEFLMFDSAVSYEGELVYGNWICNCFIMSVPHSRFISLLVNKISSLSLSKFIELSEIYEAHQLTGPTLFNYIFRKYPDCKLTCLPGLYLVPEDIRSAYTSKIVFAREVLKRKTFGYTHNRTIVIKSKGESHIRNVDRLIKESLFNEIDDITNEESKFDQLVKE